MTLLRQMKPRDSSPKQHAVSPVPPRSGPSGRPSSSSGLVSSFSASTDRRGRQHPLSNSRDPRGYPTRYPDVIQPVSSYQQVRQYTSQMHNDDDWMEDLSPTRVTRASARQAQCVRPPGAYPWESSSSETLTSQLTSLASNLAETVQAEATEATATKRELDNVTKELAKRKRKYTTDIEERDKKIRKLEEKVEKHDLALEAETKLKEEAQEKHDNIQLKLAAKEKEWEEEKMNFRDALEVFKKVL